MVLDIDFKAGTPLRRQVEHAPITATRLFAVAHADRSECCELWVRSPALTTGYLGNTGAPELHRDTSLGTMVRVRDVLAAWGSLTVMGRLGGGNRNEVLEVRRGRERLVARRSGRTPASLDWEIDLLGHLARHRLRVPTIVPALDRRRHIDGVVVQSWLDGTAPQAEDWPAVAATLRRLHAATVGWPQRPGFASTRELLEVEAGGDVDLSAMPADAVAACRQAWRSLAGRPEAVVHGDPGPSNIRVAHGEVGLLDWDEARVDCVDLDVAELPISDLPPERLGEARRAVTAWETANGWIVEPSYARRQLALLQTGRDSFA